MDDSRRIAYEHKKAHATSYGRGEVYAVAKPAERPRTSRPWCGGAGKPDYPPLPPTATDKGILRLMTPTELSPDIVARQGTAPALTNGLKVPVVVPPLGLVAQDGHPAGGRERKLEHLPLGVG